MSNRDILTLRRGLRNGKEGVETVETFESFGAVSLHLRPYTLRRFPFTQVARLGIELVGIAYQFLFGRLGEKVAAGEGEALTDYFFGGKSGAGMEGTDTGVAGKAALTEHGGAEQSVAYIRHRAAAFYRGGVCQDDSDIVEQGRLFYEIAVELRKTGVCNLQGHVGYGPRVSQKNVAERGRAAVYVVYDGKSRLFVVIHLLKLFKLFYEYEMK